MISICPQVQSTYFAFIRRELATSRIKTYSRRVSRTATLDGSSVITDSGYTDTDRTIEVRARISEAMETIVKYLFQTYTLLTIVTPDGCYTCAPEHLRFPPVAGPDNPNVILTLLISP